MSWLTTVDHKKIGFLYGISALFFFLVGGVEALLIRIQLMVPNNTFLTSHAVQRDVHDARDDDDLPGRDAAERRVLQFHHAAADRGARRRLPRLNAFSFWTFLVAGAIILNLGWFIKDGAPDGGWFGYTPSRPRQFSPTTRSTCG
jgi:cytochrome c oxidase subunit 1